MGFINTGWSIRDGIIHIPEHIEPWLGYRFILEAIYDGHLPVTRVIGYHLTTSKKAPSVKDSRLIDRDRNCIDDRLTIASNISKLLVMNYTVPRMHSMVSSGELKPSTAQFLFSQKEIPVLSPQDYILTAVNEVKAEFVLSTATGYQDANANFARLMQSKAVVSKTRYFPLFSYHNISDFIRVLPPEGRTIKLRYLYGMTDAYLLEMFEMMFEVKGKGAWYKNYEEVLV